MCKSDAEAIALFNKQVAMTSDELEPWFDDPRSREAGAELKNIVTILRKNPSRKFPRRTTRCARALAPQTSQAGLTIIAQEDIARISGRWSRQYSTHTRSKSLTRMDIPSSNSRHLAPTEELQNAKCTIGQVRAPCTSCTHRLTIWSSGQHAFVAEGSILTCEGAAGSVKDGRRDADEDAEEGEIDELVAGVEEADTGAKRKRGAVDDGDCRDVGKGAKAKHL